jgi:hypothetical protein
VSGEPFVMMLTFMHTCIRDLLHATRLCRVPYTAIMDGFCDAGFRVGGVISGAD